MEMKLLLLVMALLINHSSSNTISDRVFESQTSDNGRNLLNAKKKCEVNFEYMNYTVMTKRCKGPAFPAKECCSAFKAFACPYATYINDMNTDCAKIMFSYMNIYGNYPTGLFANECKETKKGLICPSPPLNSPNLNASNADSNVSFLLSLFFFVFLALLALA